VRVQETWDSFWGELLLRRFHLRNPERWSGREQKADWLLEHLALSPGATLVDLGCGDGVLDICLARRGYHVTAIDRIASVLEAARREAEDTPVEFIAADLCDCNLGDDRFTGAILLDTLGLLDRGAELDLLRRLQRALQPGGTVILDWPADAHATTWTRPFEDGVLQVTADFDEVSRVQTILPEFHVSDGRVIELYDPLSGTDCVGLRRYLYKLEEAQALLGEAAFRSEVIPHYQGSSGYHALLAHSQARGAKR
jgi:SAM-dependent methyltransferase